MFALLAWFGPRSGLCDEIQFQRSYIHTETLEEIPVCQHETSEKACGKPDDAFRDALVKFNEAEVKLKEARDRLDTETKRFASSGSGRQGEAEPDAGVKQAQEDVKRLNDEAEKAWGGVVQTGHPLTEALSKDVARLTGTAGQYQTAGDDFSAGVYSCGDKQASSTCIRPDDKAIVVNVNNKKEELLIWEDDSRPNDKANIVRYEGPQPTSDSPAKREDLAQHYKDVAMSARNAAEVETRAVKEMRDWLPPPGGQAPDPYPRFKPPKQQLISRQEIKRGKELQKKAEKDLQAYREAKRPGSDPKAVAAAKNYLDQRIKENPKAAPALAARAALNFKQGNNPAACADAKSAVSLNPDDASSYGIGKLACPDGMPLPSGRQLKAMDTGGKSFAAGARAADAPRLSGSRVEPPNAFDQATSGKLWGKALLSQNLTPAEALLQEALRKGHVGDWAGAWDAATRAIEADKTNARAWALRAALSNRMKDYAAAQKDATEALKLNPEYVPALLERAFARYNLGDYTGALEDVERAIKLEPMNALAYLYRGMVMEKLARFAEALADYQKAARLDPGLQYLSDEAEARISGGKPGSGPEDVAQSLRLRGAIGTTLLLLIVAGLWWRRCKAQAKEGPVKLE